jgi:hypothetical protein
MDPKNGASGNVTPGARGPAEQLEARVRKLIGEHTAARAERVDPEVVQELDRDDVDFECVSGLRAVDVDRPGHRVHARTALRHALLNQLQ